MNRYVAAVLGTLLAGPLAAQPAPPVTDYRARTPEQEVVYFVLPDRFENGDPTNDKGGLKGTGSGPGSILRPRGSIMAATSRGW